MRSCGSWAGAARASIRRARARGRPGAPERAAARGAALITDGLAGGHYAPLVERLRLREAAGSALDHLRVHGARQITLG